MPQSDTWPGGTGLETMKGMDSAGSCDSVVSAHSGSSDDNLDYLSAEEKACLMFLEETIESLDTEEDSGLSNDEPDQLSSPHSLATKLADLSASKSKSKLNGLEDHASKKTVRDNVEPKLIYSYLVPTPFVIANNTPCSVSSAKTFQSKLPVQSKDHSTGHKDIQKPVAHSTPSEVHVAMSPPTKHRDFSGKTCEGPLPRGPLSYEALFHLRRSASAKKTPLCPTIDHTIEKHTPSPKQTSNNVNRPRFGRSLSEDSKPKTSPPIVAPKPKVLPANVPVKGQTGPKPMDSSYSIKHVKDPKVVRLEALQKLGLLEGEESENDAVAPLPSSKSQSSFDPMPNRFTKAPSSCNATRSPSFCQSEVLTEPKNRPLQSSASFHHYSKQDQQPVSSSNPAQSNGWRRASLERSATFDGSRVSENWPEQQHVTSAKPVKPPSTSPLVKPLPKAPPVAQKPSKPQQIHQSPSNMVGYTVMVVPGMGADRKEALRKLGLLKD